MLPNSTLSQILYQIVAIPQKVANFCKNLCLSRHNGQNQTLNHTHTSKPNQTHFTNESYAKKPILVMSLGRGGGCSQYAFEVLKHFTIPYTLYQTTYTIEDSKPNAIKVITYHNNKYSFVLNSLFILPLLFVRIFREARRHSVLFLPYFHFWNFAFIIAFRLRSKKVVIVEHDGIVHSGDEYPFQQTLLNLCLRLSSEIIFLSEFVRNRVQVDLSHKKVHIIPHGLYDFKGLQTIPKPYNPKPTILFFGRINRYKGLQNLIDAISLLPQESYEKLIIAGKSSIEYDISGLSSHKIEVLDRFLDKEEITAVFNRSHILVLPYIEASQSGVVAIAIANAIPVICTDVGGFREQLTLNGGGL